MQELIFFAVIILFSIFESIARKKKKAGQQVPDSGEWEPETVEWEVDEHSLEQEPRADTGSEAMIPSEIWEEIAGLARGRGAGAPTRPTPPSPPPRSTTPIEPIGRGGSSRERGPARPAHRVHRAHASYGTDPSSRPRSEQDVGPVASHLSADAKRVRSVLSGAGGQHALRQAIILHEVLGPPPGLADE